MATYCARKYFRELAGAEASDERVFSETPYLNEISIMISDVLLNTTIASIYPDIKSELRGSLSDPGTGLTINWGISKPPVILGGRSAELAFDMDIDVVTDKGDVRSGTVSYMIVWVLNGSLDF